MDETEDDETEDDSSALGSYRKMKVGKFRKGKRDSNDFDDADEEDYVLEERFRKGGDFFQATESINLIQRPETKDPNSGGIIKMVEGVDKDGVYCVNFGNIT